MSELGPEWVSLTQNGTNETDVQKSRVCPISGHFEPKYDISGVGEGEEGQGERRSTSRMFWNILECSGITQNVFDVRQICNGQ